MIPRANQASTPAFLLYPVLFDDWISRLVIDVIGPHGAVLASMRCVCVGRSAESSVQGLLGSGGRLFAVEMRSWRLVLYRLQIPVTRSPRIVSHLQRHRWVFTVELSVNYSCLLSAQLLRSSRVPFYYRVSRATILSRSSEVSWLPIP